MTDRKKAVPVVAADPASEPVVRAIKGFAADLSCSPNGVKFQYELGGTYTHDGKVKHCSAGFHACDAEAHPLDVFNYYPPAGVRFADVLLGGTIDRDPSNSKIAAARITIEAEIALPELIQRAVKWVFDRAKWSEGPVVTGANDGATASGYQGAATASGTRGAATASGYQGAATASGYQGAAKGATGCALFLLYRDPYSGEIQRVWAGIAGRDGIKADVFYRLNGAGQPEELV
jgi:hypothetical protein